MVTIQSKLSEINEEDLSFVGSDTQYATHGMHTWLAAMIPMLARFLIEKTEARSLLDPFCGGGAVCVEGILKGLPTAGVEINPLGVIVTKAKTTHIRREMLYQHLGEILQKVNNYKGPDLIYPERAKAFMIHYWFKPYMFRPLSALAYAINSIEDDNIRTFFQCVLSATARDVSLTYRNEIRLRRLEPSKMKKFNPNVLKRFLFRVKDSINRVQKLPVEAKAKIILGSALKMPFADDEFTTIICSPPYGDERNGVPYFQFAKNMLYWLGWNKEDLMKLKSQTLGWVGKRNDFKCHETPTLKQLIKTLNKNQRVVLEAMAFYSDYYKALKEMARVTSDKIVIVIGNRVLMKTLIDNGKITTELFNTIGVKCVKYYVRQLPSKRLPKLTWYGGGGIDKEHILIYDVSRKNI